MQLSNIAITHISLVKSGSNGKSLIYKSAKEVGDYEKSIEIKKSDKEEGVVYGIVYAPDEEDSQGDQATAQEIKKAAYAFMKAKNIENVDVEHSFSNVDAFVAESWIVKTNDEHFPEDEGAWAVAIKLESEELKTLAKSGKLAGLSMAGGAVKKSEEKKTKKIGAFFQQLSEVMGEVWIDFHTTIKKGEDVDMDKYKKELVEKMNKGLAGANKEFEDIKKASEESADDVKKIKETVETQAQEIADLKEELKAKNEELKKLSDGAKETKKEIKEVKKSAKENRDALKQSRQNTKPDGKKHAGDNDEEGVL